MPGVPKFTYTLILEARRDSKSKGSEYDNQSNTLIGAVPSCPLAKSQNSDTNWVKDKYGQSHERGVHSGLGVKEAGILAIELCSFALRLVGNDW